MHPPIPRPYRTRLLLITAATAISHPILAITYEWKPTSPSAFNNPLSWSPNAVPGPADTARFVSNVTHTVNLTANATTQFLHIASDRPIFNFSPGVTYTVTAGSNVLTGAQLGLAAGQTSNLTLQGAGTLAAGSFSAADVAGTTSSVVVQSGATLDVDGITYIGRRGTADLQVTSGGHVLSRDGGLYLSYEPGSTSKLTVNGAASTLTTNFPLVAGYQGAAIVDVSGGATLNTGTTTLGRHSGSTAVVTLSDPGTTWTDHGQFLIGDFGAGTLTVQSGAHLSTPFFVVNGGNGTTTANPVLTLTGAGSRIDVSGAALLGNGGGGPYMTLSSGAVLTSTAGTVGHATALTSTLELKDANTAWTMSGFLHVGRLGRGALALSRNATLSNSNAVLAQDIGSRADVTVDSSATWTNNGYLIVGSNGHATLAITNGGQVSATSVNLGHFAGNNPQNTGTGSVGVTGLNSSLTASDGIFVGVAGTGSLGIQNRGRVQSLYGVVGFDGPGQVGVAGTGSLWSLAQHLHIHNGDVGITSSGAITSATLVVGDPAKPAVKGSLQLDNAATYTATASATINPNGTLSLGLTPTTPSTLVSPSVTNAGTILGTGIIQGNLTSSGTLSPGNTVASLDAVGSLSVQGTLQLSTASTLNLSISGPTPALHDQLLSTAHMSLAGTLNVSFPSGAGPTGVTTYHVLSFPSASGAFSTINLPALGAGLVWDTAQLPTAGNLRVLLGAGWGVDSSGGWNIASNWNGPIPTGTDAVAIFGPVITAPRLVTLNSTRTVGSVRFNSAQPYTLSPFRATRLELSTTSGNATLESQSGDHVISADVRLLSDAVASVSPGASLRLVNLDDNAAGRNLTKTGQGTLQLQSFSLANLTVSAGLLTTPSPASDPTAVTVNHLTSLTISPGATVDLTRNALAITYPGAPHAHAGSELIRQYLLDDLLVSSLSSATHSLGYLLTNSTLTIRLTPTGDANLDGQLNEDDFALLDKGRATGGQFWWEGDFTHDGIVDGNDYLAIDSAYLLTAAPESLSHLLALRQAQFGPAYVSTLLTAIPEPSSLFSILHPLSSLLLIRRRKSC